MPFTLKNISSFPLDVPTLSGPEILPIGGAITVDLDALAAEIMRQSPMVEVCEAVDPLDHDGDGRKGGSKPAEASEELAKLRADYLDLFGKKPFHGWSADDLRKKIDDQLSEGGTE